MCRCSDAGNKLRQTQTGEDLKIKAVVSAGFVFPRQSNSIYFLVSLGFVKNFVLDVNFLSSTLMLHDRQSHVSQNQLKKELCSLVVHALNYTKFNIATQRICIGQGFLRCFRDPIRVPRIENRVPRIRENYHRVPRIRENRVPKIREIGSLQVHSGY